MQAADTRSPRPRARSSIPRLQSLVSLSLWQLRPDGTNFPATPNNSSETLLLRIPLPATRQSPQTFSFLPQTQTPLAPNPIQYMSLPAPLAIPTENHGETTPQFRVAIPFPLPGGSPRPAPPPAQKKSRAPKTYRPCKRSCSIPTVQSASAPENPPPAFVRSHEISDENREISSADKPTPPSAPLHFLEAPLSFPPPKETPTAAPDV